MKCSKCGAENEAGSQFCANCGTPLTPPKVLTHSQLQRTQQTGGSIPAQTNRASLPRMFDLNIEEVLENWEVEHAIREVIANALDEQVLTRTADIEITKDREGNWHIRDFGRGLRIEHFTLRPYPTNRVVISAQAKWTSAS